MDVLESVGFWAGIALPFFNISLIGRIIRRKSSRDISLFWTFGIWTCILLMTPNALRSGDPAFRAFGVVNAIFFSAVVFFVLRYHRPPGPDGENR